VMTVFNSFYSMVDGLFVSNLIGMEALSAINLTAPAIALITAISGMLATGGSAVVMNKMGEGRDREAREDFTLLIAANAVAGAVIGGVIGNSSERSGRRHVRRRRRVAVARLVLQRRAEAALPRATPVATPVASATTWKDPH